MSFTTTTSTYDFWQYQIETLALNPENQTKEKANKLKNLIAYYYHRK